jgi:hypothetical protein
MRSGLAIRSLGSGVQWRIQQTLARFREMARGRRGSLCGVASRSCSTLAPLKSA